MATIPSKKLVKKMQRKTKRAIFFKKVRQMTKGFKPTDAGVIPEKTWRKM